MNDAPRAEDSLGDGLDAELEEDDLYDLVMASTVLPEPPRPINWNLLSSGDAEAEWLALNQWVDQIRRTYGLPASVIPPFWYRHPELVWELSALHLHWIASYDPEQDASGPIAWHTDFALARERLREWVATCGTRIDRDRPTRQTIWPGEAPQAPIEDEVIANRMEDFIAFVAADVQSRQDIEDDFIRAKQAADCARDNEPG
ncbi:hypothetical protein [Leucobacter ruminantium]|uniref:DUF4913 domain-containing protein n=1 Tax=Leucobacter ruminantium TaxID=1289170 RepID=A0A939M131_9MICO|nr:hypothetical protein [Leucobacter ruminantium]MBO1806057.1 hypothetical protein [Leucobacter ruminantium]